MSSGCVYTHPFTEDGHCLCTILIKVKGHIFISAWALVLSVQSQWAIPEPQFVERTTATIPRLFVSCIEPAMSTKRSDMSTLSNVKSRGDGAESPSVGFASNSIPKANSSQTGVSVRYAQDPGKRWYVLRATYERAEKAYDFIINDDKDSDAYIAMHFVKKKVNGKLKRVKAPLVGGLIFVYCAENLVKEYVNNTPQISFVRFYYNHCDTHANGTNPVMEVDYESMMNFIRVSSVDDDNIMQIDPEYVHYVSGESVVVTDGKFKGVRGRVARAAGQRRVIVELEGIALIATAYIPAAYLEKV